MPPTQGNSSFIPKRSPSKKVRPRQRGGFSLLSIISTAVFVAAFIASGAVFLYERQVNNEFAATVLELNEAINSFSEADMSRVVDFDDRLKLTASLVGSHVSLTELLTILEQNTTNNIQFTKVTIERATRDEVLVTAAGVTAGLNNVIFQEATYGRSSDVVGSTVSELTFGYGEVGTVPVELVPVTFTSEFVFSPEYIQYRPGQAPAVTLPVSAGNDSADGDVPGAPQNTDVVDDNDLSL